MFTNQIRMKIGVMFGSPETTTGGNALKFYASQRLDIRRIGAIKESNAKGEQVVGNRTRVKVVKNKMAPPFREVEFDITYGKGISLSGELVDLGVDAGIVQKSGSWFSLGPERIGQGRDNARTYLEEHPEAMVAIERELLAKNEIVRLGDKPIVVEPTPSAAAAEGEEGANGSKGRNAARRAARPN
jgi:recombination protein RecA